MHQEEALDVEVTWLQVDLEAAQAVRTTSTISHLNLMEVAEAHMVKLAVRKKTDLVVSIAPQDSI